MTDSLLPEPRPARTIYASHENYSVRFDNGMEYVTRHLWEAESICETFRSLNPTLICTFNGWDMTPAHSPLCQ